jgi:AcrR family transcriptional regulator
VKPAETLGLRERKKQRTRETIVRAALELFATQGYEATTLAEIAAAAEVAPSTLHAYFPSKDDLVFSRHASIIESAKERVLSRPPSESVADGIKAWCESDLPALAETDDQQVRLRRAIIDANEELATAERQRLTVLENVFAEAFAHELGESSDDLRSRLIASVAVSGLTTVWLWWYRQHVDDNLDSREAYKLDATYVIRLIEGAQHAIEALPSPSKEPRQNSKGSSPSFAGESP